MITMVPLDFESIKPHSLRARNLLLISNLNLLMTFNKYPCVFVPTLSFNLNSFSPSSGVYTHTLTSL